MPNWCENDLYVDGPVADVEKFKQHVGMFNADPTFDFGTVIPYPDNFKQMDAECPSWQEEDRTAKLEAYKAKWGTDKDGYNSGGYEWCIHNWGTKWSAGDVSVYDHPKRGECIAFNTAWSPPIPIIAKLNELFPTLTFVLEYFECGAAFCGGATFYSQEECKDYGYEFGEAQGVWSGEYAGPRGG